MNGLGSDAAHPIPIVDDEEDEVEDLLGDTSRGSSNAPGARRTTNRPGPRRRTKEETDSQRQWRREKIAARTRPTTTFYEDLQEVDMIDLTADTPKKGYSGPVPPPPAAKRKSEPTIHCSNRVPLI